ncbi:MAG: efflux RND transporter periplasmic adaptor subunit [Thermoguttaceae bacterium]|jgi:HlyD family secretion protein|nr:efflux RND transporter periplasmic adaptor subunit [Thermoguttaceae bacterium]
MNPRKVVPVLVVAAAILAALVYRFGIARSNHDAPGVLRVSGNIEVTDVEVGFKIPGRVEQRLVDEGMWVEQGQVIARLDQRDLEAEVAMRRAELEAATALWDELRAGTRPEEIAAAKAAMEKAAAALEAAEKGSRPQEIRVAESAVQSALTEKIRLEAELARAEKLYQSHIISQETYDRQKAAFDVAAAQLVEAQQRLELAREGPRAEEKDQARRAYLQAKAQFDLAVAGPRRETIAQAAAKVAQAKAALELAETRLSYATIVAPFAGVVLSKNVEPGEYVAPGTPVVTLGDLSRPWLRAYIDAEDLERVKYGQEARVTTDGRPGKVYQGRVGFIASEAEFTPKNVQTEKERTKLVYRIKIYVENPELELKRGMPADAEIVVGTP